MTSLFAVVAMLSAVAAEMNVRQVFRPERLDRGDTNVRRLQPVDGASWIWGDGEPLWGECAYSHAQNVPFDFASRPTRMYRFRRRFASDGTPLRFDVSADERFTLILDGRAIARGPHRGIVEHWYYQSYEVTGLPAGEHLLEAVVWQLGDHAPLAQLTYRGGFLLKAEGVYDKLLTTGVAAWEAAPLTGTRMTDPGPSGAFGAGSQCEVSGAGFPTEQPSFDGWRTAVVVRGPVRVTDCGVRVKGWMLFPTERPDQVYVRRTPGTFRAAGPAADTNAFYVAAEADSPWVPKFNALLRNAQPVVIPSHTDVRLAWDLDDYYCAYPELTVSGGKGARVEWAWAEGMRNDRIIRNGRCEKANRDVFVGKNMVVSFRDAFLSDGRLRAAFTTPWWRCGRWCELRVTTGDEPLTLDALSIGETHYPIQAEGSFSCDDPTVEPILRICRRTLESCVHEMVFDCPFYEQQMYPGDTRLQLLFLNALTHDDRMARFAMSAFDWGSRDNGLVPMNYPSRGLQESVTYTLCWILMFRDYLMWKDDLAFLRAHMPAVRHALMSVALHENADGFLANLPGWSFMDWEHERFKDGVAPDGGVDARVSSLENLLYVMALQSAAAVDGALGETHFAAQWREKAEALGKRIVGRFWDEGRGLVSDTLDRRSYSEHGQCLAILGGLLTAGQRARAFRGLVEDADLAKTSSYFAHYLLETYAACSRTDLLLKRLETWRNYFAWGARTTFETQHCESRSDCHAWSACPLYALPVEVAGIRPAAPGFREVRIAPAPARLGRLHAVVPHPRGRIEVTLDFAGGHAVGAVVLPENVTGVFEWGGRSLTLTGGRREIDLLGGKQ